MIKNVAIAVICFSMFNDAQAAVDKQSGICDRIEQCWCVVLHIA